MRIWSSSSIFPDGLQLILPAIRLFLARKKLLSVVVLLFAVLSSQPTVMVRRLMPQTLFDMSLAVAVWDLPPPANPRFFRSRNFLHWSSVVDDDVRAPAASE